MLKDIQKIQIQKLEKTWDYLPGALHTKSFDLGSFHYFKTFNLICFAIQKRRKQIF